MLSDKEKADLLFGTFDLVIDEINKDPKTRFLFDAIVQRNKYFIELLKELDELKARVEVLEGKAPDQKAV